MNGNRDRGFLERIRDLVDEVLRDFSRPLSEEVIDDVLCAIENNVGWRNRFDQFCTESRRGTVCQRIGLAVSEALGQPDHINRCRRPRNGLSRSYTRLRVPDARLH